MNTKSPTTVEDQIRTMKNHRRDLIDKLSQINGSALEHIENGSFEMVEQALKECCDGLCEMQKVIQEDKQKRRVRKRSGGGTDEQATSASPIG